MLKHIVSIIISVISMNSFADDFVAGKDYKVLPAYNKIKVSGDSANVTEFFSYGCPWCYKLEPEIKKWVKQQAGSIFFVRVPVVFHPDWKYYAKAYYTIRALALSPQVSDDLFKAIIVDKKSLNNNQAMVNFFVSHGVEESIAKSAFENSPSLDMQLKADEEMLARYQIRGVPTFVVNGEYETNLQLAKSEERLFAILDFLVNKAKPQAPKEFKLNPAL